MRFIAINHLIALQNSILLYLNTIFNAQCNITIVILLTILSHSHNFGLISIKENYKLQTNSLWQMQILVGLLVLSSC